jgi:hypothetical protein
MTCRLFVALSVLSSSAVRYFVTICVARSVSSGEYERNQVYGIVNVYFA